VPRKVLRTLRGVGRGSRGLTARPESEAASQSHAFANRGRPQNTLRRHRGLAAMHASLPPKPEPHKNATASKCLHFAAKEPRHLKRDP